MKFNQTICSSTINTINSSKNSMIGNIENISKVVEKISNDWTGTASENYCKDLKKSLQKMENYCDELNLYVNALNQLIEEVNDVEKNNLKLVNNIF